MKNLLSKTLFILIAVMLLLSCSNSDDPIIDYPTGKDVFRMQMVTLDLPNTILSDSEYHGFIGEEMVSILKSDDHELLFMMPSTIASGNQNLVIDALNLNVKYNVKDLALPDLADATISPFQINLSTFQTTTLGNNDTFKAINSFNQVYENSTGDDKIKIATLYYANKSLFDNIILNDYSSITGKNNQAAIILLYKHKAAVIGMTTGLYLVLWGEPVEKAIGAALLCIAAKKAKGFGSEFVNLSINSLSVEMDNIVGTNNKTLLIGLQLQNDVQQSVVLKTVDRTIITTDISKNNTGAKLYFTYNSLFNRFVQQANPLLQWINDNVAFANLNLLAEQVTPSDSGIINNLVDTTTFNHLTLSITDPNLSLVSSGLTTVGQLNIKVKILGSSTSPINSVLNYSYTDEFSTFSGTLPIIVSSNAAEIPLTISNPTNYPLTEPDGNGNCNGFVHFNFTCSETRWNSSLNAPTIVNDSGVIKTINGGILKNITNNWGFTSTTAVNTSIYFSNISIANGVVTGEGKLLGDFGSCVGPFSEMYFTSFNFALINTPTIGNLQTSIVGVQVGSNYLYTSQ